MSSHAQAFNLESIVAKPTWKEILLGLIDSKELDPWNVDIVAISDAYIKKIKEMEKLSLVMPANIILAASILLRYKSEYIRFIGPAQEVIVPLAGDENSILDIPQLELNARIPPKRQITLDELIQEMEKIIKYENAERVVKRRGGIEDIVNITFREFDIEKKMGETLEKIKAGIDSEGWTIFSGIINKNERADVLYTLMALLHLTQKQMIDIKQDELFGEIFICLLPLPND